MNRLRDAVLRARAEGRACLAAYWPAGFPSPEEDAAFFEAAGRADIVEVGIPFSDPAADGPTLQAASTQALAAGASVAGALERIAGLRRAHPGLPIAVMTYANLVHRPGWDDFAHAARTAGADGLILPDVPFVESAVVRRALDQADLAWVPVVSPVSGARRQKEVAAVATGFLYLASNVGLTGQAGLPASAAGTVRDARAAVGDVPLLVGFGVRTADHVASLHAAGADGAIVGSALVELAAKGPPAVARHLDGMRRRASAPSSLASARRPA